MANLLILKRRIKTAQNVSKTTKAMQMIATSKLKKAQDEALLAKPYVKKLDYLAKEISMKINSDNSHPYILGNNSDSTLIIVLSPDKGLSGGLVTNLSKEILEFDQKKTFVVTVGKKAEGVSARLNKNMIASFPFGTTLPSFESVFPLLNLIDEYYLSNKVSEVKILSTTFENIFTQKAEMTDLLPLRLNEKIESGMETLFEPSVDELVPDLLRHYLEMVLFQKILEAYASEQGSRMIAMKNATDNAIEIIDELKLEYNKSRQEKITNELLDITGASMIYG